MDGLFLDSLFSVLLKRSVIPSDFHGRAVAIKEMLADDVSGLVDSLTDFSVNAASVNFSVETDNEVFTKILKKWLNEINRGYKGKIPSGVGELAKEYFRERWKGSSFPVLKISEWGEMDGIIVPIKAYFVDGGSIYAEDIDKDSEELKLINYKYYIGRNCEDKNKLDKNVIFSKASGRWFDKYPVPFLIKRGVYHNYKIIQSLKNKETEILEQVIPYLFLIKKGTEGLATEGVKTYTDTELIEVIKSFQDLMTEMKSSKGRKVKAPIRATQFDEELKHLIPDLSSIFNKDLFVVAERNILSGLGFIDVIEAVSTTRKESLLNPKIFIEEVKVGVESFKQVIKELIFLIKEKNEEHKKYFSPNLTFHIVSSPVKGFMTDDFKTQLRLLWERGQLSNQTYCSMVGEVSYQTEVSRREKESKRGHEYIMYPHLTRNEEGKGIDIVGEEPIDKDTDKRGKPIPVDKIDDRQKYDIGKLIGSPYTEIKELPDTVRKKLSLKDQRKWMKIWNSAYFYMLGKTGDRKRSETYAFRVAWSQIRRVKAEIKIKKRNT